MKQLDRYLQARRHNYPGWIDDYERNAGLTGRPGQFIAGWYQGLLEDLIRRVESVTKEVE